MKKFLIIAAVIIVISCHAKKESAKESPAMNIKYPYEIKYSAEFEKGDPQQARMITEIWKDWDHGDLQVHKDHFADSLEMHFSDGSVIHAARDRFLAIAQQFRNGFANVTTRVDAITPLKSTDKNENWVLIWVMETDTDKKGKADSFYLQETWRFNKAGKADLLYQYRAAANAANK